jgi:DNA-binding NarL/FixJ family response regulator
MDDQKLENTQQLPTPSTTSINNSPAQSPIPESTVTSNPKPASVNQGPVLNTKNSTGEANGWTVLLVEDNPTTRQEIMDYFSRVKIDGKPLIFHEISEWRDAFMLIRERKADLVILDIYRGEAKSGGEKVGERVLKQIQISGFVAVVLYTNLPEGLEDSVNEFVKLVPKTAGLKELHKTVESVFATKIPQIHREIVNQMDRSLSSYMWGFVVDQWNILKEIADKPEFLRLLIQRLAISMMREGIDSAVDAVFGQAQRESNPEGKIHPAEMYIKPPIGPDPLLGDIRVRVGDNANEYLVVVWPSCDMVSVGDRSPKTDKVLCVRAGLFDDAKEAAEYREAKSKNNEKRLIKLMMNNRDSNIGQADQFHYLPGICDFPDLLVDFQDTKPMNLEELKGLRCVATIASPFAESLASRFMRYIGRLGTPDLDIALLLQRFL